MPKITTYRNEEITEVINQLLVNKDIKIQITETNINTIYNEWKNSVEFKTPVQNEQDLINLFLVDALNGAKYQQNISEGMVDMEQTLIREGTHLDKYVIEKTPDKIRIIYNENIIYSINDVVKYNNFWNKYQRPPEKQEFLKIIERSAKLYTDKYRRDTGGEYTPSSFVALQNKILKEKGYNLEEFLVCDTCGGVGNLENEFGMEYKQSCYLSTLEDIDVETCKIKGFENVIQYDYLKNNEQPRWRHQGVMRGIDEICNIEGKKLMVIINPPYQQKKGFKNNLAIEFFNKILKLNPEVVVFYYRTESFFREEIEHYIKSKYKIASHAMSDASTTFQLSEWPISQVIFDKNNGETIDKSKIKIDRYELEKKSDTLNFVKTYTYNEVRPNLIKEIEKEIKKNQTGLVLGQWSYLTYIIIVSNGGKEKSNKITTNNLKYALLSKGISFNSHAKYFERNYHCYRGTVDKIPQELFNDSIMFALFFKNFMFSNKETRNAIMPFTNKELGCNKNDLNVLRDEYDTENAYLSFDFRQWLSQFEFSVEASELYKAALQVFLYYHRSFKNTNYNDSFYDITNAIMGKDTSKFKALDRENDTRISQTKTTKGTTGFGKNTIKSAVGSADLPIFYDFFNARDVLAKKINRQLVESGLLLWERENIY